MNTTVGTPVSASGRLLAEEHELGEAATAAEEQGQEQGGFVEGMWAGLPTVSESERERCFLDLTQHGEKLGTLPRLEPHGLKQNLCLRHRPNMIATSRVNPWPSRADMPGNARCRPLIFSPLDDIFCRLQLTT